MNNFIIGQYGTYDKEKFNKDYRSGMWGIEACMMKTQEDLDTLMDTVEKHDLNLGVHFPLRAGIRPYRDPQYLSQLEDYQEDAYAYMTTEFEYISKQAVDYVLLHYPKPVVLDERVDWFGRQWWFGHESEYCYLQSLDIDQFKKDSHYFFKWFERESKKHGFRPIIELDGLAPLLYESDFLLNMFEKYDIDLCIDIGRLHLQDQIDDHFDAKVFVHKMKNHIKEVHLWNVKVGKEVNNSHYPALKHLDPNEGWADVSSYFNLLTKQDFKVLFEHQTHAITEDELEACYQWIKTLI